MESNGEHGLDVMALATYPVEAAASRYRVVQFIEPLAKLGIRMTFAPFLSSRGFASLYDRKRIGRTAAAILRGVGRRSLQAPSILRADALFIQRETMLVGPPIFEWLAALTRRPFVLDMDDPIWIEQPRSVYGRLATLLKWPWKTDQLIRMASSVVCGSAAIADHVGRIGQRTVIAPTIVDTERFVPVETRARDRTPVIGWIGTHSTFAYFETLIPVFQRLAETFRFRLRIVGSGREAVEIKGVDVETKPWTLDREIEDFATLDIGVYPLAGGRWEEGKSAFKAVQYLTVGVPFVASPVGSVRSIGVDRTTHFLADSTDDWYDALSRLLSNPELRERMGNAGRTYAVAHYSVARHAEVIAGELRRAVRTRGRSARA